MASSIVPFPVGQSIQIVDLLSIKHIGMARETYIASINGRFSIESSINTNYDQLDDEADDYLITRLQDYGNRRLESEYHNHSNILYHIKSRVIALICLILLQA